MNSEMNSEPNSAVISVRGPQMRLPLQAAGVTRQLVGSSAVSDGSGIQPSSWWDALRSGLQTGLNLW
jgi:hypothetical protein